MSTQTAPRLRAACTECHTSKVKCSGEKTGCVRCRNMGLECHFGISMVGKCSPFRRRRRLKTTSRPARSEIGKVELAQQTPIITTPSSAATTTSKPGTAADDPPPPITPWTSHSSFDLAMVLSPPQSLLDLDDNPMLDGPFSKDLGDFLSSCLSSPPDTMTFPDTARSPTCFDNFHMCDVYKEAGTSSSNGGGGHDATLVVTGGGDTSAGGLLGHPPPMVRDSTDARFAGLQECFRMITILEQQLNNSYRVTVDQVMHTSRTFAEQLGTSIQQDVYLRGTAGPLLALTAVEQIAQLFEASIPGLSKPQAESSGGGAPTFPEPSSPHDADNARPTATTTPSNNFLPNTNTNSRNGSGSTHTYPHLTLGDFRADPEEAGLIWRHVIAGELRRILRLVCAISAESGPGSATLLGSSRRTPYITSRQRLCEGLKQRIKAMISSIGDL